MTQLSDEVVERPVKEIYQLRRKAVEMRACQKCGAQAGKWCKSANGAHYDPRWTVHASRMDGTA